MDAEVNDEIRQLRGFEHFHTFEDGELIVGMTTVNSQHHGVTKQRTFVATNHSLYEIVGDRLVHLKLEVVDAQ